MILKRTWTGVSIGFLIAANALSLTAQTNSSATNAPSPIAPSEIRTPKTAATPRINGPSVFGVRPGHPVVYHIPATGDRPIVFSADNLPAGLTLDAKTGNITGSLKSAGEYTVTLRAKNAMSVSEKRFRFIAGETIALTPAMGWNSWNCWGTSVDQNKVLKSARAMVSSRLIDHGFSYINIDDAWQAQRGGPFHGLQGNQKFPDLKALCDAIHGMGLRAGIYSTPWVTSYAGYPGGSSENADGHWEKPTIPKKGNVNKKILPWAIGKYHFNTNDARQWAAWGIDYLKYDWSPNEVPETQEMYDALRASGRDVVFSLSNNSPFKNAAGLAAIASSWRTTGDIRDNWETVSHIILAQDRWRPFARAGHRNDPDMLVIGYVGGWGGRQPKPSSLTGDEQYTHITLWCLFGAPLLIGCDMERLDAFTFNLLSNDEVLAVDQDALAGQAECVNDNDGLRVYVKDLEDGSKAVGLINLGETAASITAKWDSLKVSGKQTVRDLWRQKDLGQFDGQFHMTVAPHGAELMKLSAARLAMTAREP